MATVKKPRTHPGDIVQEATGLIYIVNEVHSWGVGAFLGGDDTRYTRLRGDYVVLGPAQMMLSAEMSAARRASLKHAAELDAEAEAEQAKAQEPGR